MPSTPTLLPALGHAASGATGTVLSTLATYPLDLVNTRLKVQRQLRLDGSIQPGDTYTGICDAFRSIYAKEGGLSAFFAGLGADVGKSAADSFLFFLFYTWFRARRLATHKNVPYLRAAEELAVGAAAGACAKLFTTPVSNVVTRRQTASLLDNNTTHTDSTTKAEGKTARIPTFSETISDLRRERGGVLGLWAGYSASLVLTLNPSITFFLQQALKRVLVPREGWDEPGAGTTFFLAAVSKVVATAATYPFQIAKARVQVSAAGPGEKKGEEGGGKGNNIFATVLRIARAEGGRALYDGIGGELLKGFFSHGTTMLSKDVIHRLIVQLYFAILAVLRRNPQFRARLSEKMKKVRDEARERYLRASSSGANEVRRGARYVRSAVDSGQNTPANWLSAIQKKVGS
ncbi:peroxisomal adenine nucleotide transporter 1 [Parachaetomium inaequale]|uniref:Peroxisomal adenine nucleotide transporter 1 n=1 Tax=Parachaetomium inaequale TaxID=2588326 RepID=A0AAN6SLW2_9PEZI|nr:peroxisomal adenine nucleotide transporter 1 [Parachaetomium inaequale]